MKDVISSQGAVIAADRIAAEAGTSVLRRGGNAVDAIVAAALVECVVQPHNVGLGGYAGTLIIYSAAEDRVIALDFDGSAPLAAAPDIFPVECCTDNWNIEGDNAGRLAGPNEHGALCITAPPIVAGLALALETCGTFSFEDAAAYAQVAAEYGFEVYPQLARALDLFSRYADGESRLALLPDGVAPKAGETLVQRDLAALFAHLRKHGPQAMYIGEIPRMIVDVVRGMGGILSEEDFRLVSPRVEEPLSVACGDCRVYTPRPPAGGLTALQIARAMEMMPIGDTDFGTAGYYHLLMESARHAWSDRFTHLGDPLVVDVPVDDLLSDEYIDQIRRKVQSGTDPAAVGAGLAGAGHTVHLVAADRQRNMASLTTTHGSWFGSLVAVRGAGLVLGHGMSRFDPVPGRANSIAPGKRMQHNMSPLILTRNGRPYCAIGLPGGRKIVNASALLAHSIARFGLTPGEAIDLPRFHLDGPGTALVDSEALAARIHSQFGVTYPASLSASRLGGPAAGVMLAQQTNQLLAASEAGPECVAVVQG